MPLDMERKVPAGWHAGCAGVAIARRYRFGAVSSSREPQRRAAYKHHSSCRARRRHAGRGVSGGQTVAREHGRLRQLFDISLRNSVMLMSHHEHLANVEEEPWNRATAVCGASGRLVAIPRTAQVTPMALQRLAVMSGAADNETEGRWQSRIPGGLVTSAALNSIVLPTLALRAFRAGRACLARRQRRRNRGAVMFRYIRGRRADRRLRCHRQFESGANDANRARPRGTVRVG